MINKNCETRVRPVGAENSDSAWTRALRAGGPTSHRRVGAENSDTALDQRDRWERTVWGSRSRPSPLPATIEDPAARDDRRSVPFRFLYLIFIRLPGLLTLLSRASSSKDVEILIL